MELNSLNIRHKHYQKACRRVSTSLDGEEYVRINEFCYLGVHHQINLKLTPGQFFTFYFLKVS